MATCDRCGNQLTGNAASHENHRRACERVPTPDVLHRLNAAGMSIRRISEIYGTTHHFVTKQLRDAGLKRADGRWRKWQKRLTELPDWAPKPPGYVTEYGDQCKRCKICEGEYGPLTVTVTDGMCNLCEVEIAAKARRERVQAQMAGPYPRSERGAALQGVM